MKDLAQKVIYNFEDSDNILIKTLSEEDQIELIKEIVKIFRTWKKENCIKSKFFLNKNFEKISLNPMILFVMLVKSDYKNHCKLRITTKDFSWPDFIATKYPIICKRAKNFFKKNEIEYYKLHDGTLDKQFQEKYLKDFE